jgi:drug/metabolite transporter (DMT)-like permease
LSRRGWLLFAAMGVIWGLPYLLIKISVREIAPSMLVEIRTGGGALMLLPIAIARGDLRQVLRRWKPVLAFAVSETALPWLFLFNAEQKLSSSLSGLLVAAVPLVGAVLGRLTGGDRLDRRRFAGLLVGLAGVGALVGFDVGRSDLWAAASLGFVAVGYALGAWILSRHLADLPGLGVITVALGFCAVIYVPIAAFSVPTHSLTTSVVVSAVTLTVVCTAVAFVVFFQLITEVGPVRATLITYVNPAVAVLLGVSVLGERFGRGTVAGFVLIVVGCLLTTSRGTPATADETVPPGPDGVRDIA